MPTINGCDVPPTKSWDEFEDICLSMAKIRWNSVDCFRHGRAGQAQKGVDIYGYTANGFIGIQCKLTAKEAVSKGLENLIGDAEAFLPPLDAFYLAVSTPHDASLQSAVREITRKRLAKGEFPVEILFWDDIISDLAREPKVFFQHFPHYAPPPAQEPLPSHGQKPTFSIDELGVVRQFALGGFNIRISSFIKFGIYTGTICIFAMLLSSFSNDLALPLSGFATMLLLGLGMTSLAIAGAMKNKKFEPFLFRRFYIEASRSGRVYVSSFTAVCPWCASRMRLWNVGPKAGPRDDLFICTRNSRQHTVLLDPTVLPEVED